MTAADVLDPDREIAFPASVVEMLRGDLGQPPGGWPGRLQAKALKGEAPITAGPASLLPPTDLAAARRAGREAKLGRQLSDDELASYLMYPKVFTDFAATRAQIWARSRCCRRRSSSMACSRATRSTIEIEQGKALVVSACRPSARPTRKGRSRSSSSSTASRASSRCPTARRRRQWPSRRKAEEGNDAHVAAPMPGAVSTIAVKPGQEVKAGDVLSTIEAMKMETSLHAPRDGKSREVLVGPASQIDAKDLLVVLEPVA